MQSDTLRFFRITKNLKQKTLAGILGMSQPNYSDLENGKTRVSDETAKKLGAYFKVNYEIFLDEHYPLTNPALGSDGFQGENNPDIHDLHYELLDPILLRMELLLNMIADEKEELAAERKRLSEVFVSLANGLGARPL